MSRIKALVIGVVIILSLVQIPLDIRTKVLSRKATLLTTVALLTFIGAESARAGSVRWLAAGVGMVLIIGVGYYLLHHCLPEALGFGDVLLVIPLTLAVSYVGIEGVLHWQLLAACTGALHAIVMRLWRGQRSIPFGPHLLLAALAVLIVSV